MSEAEDRKVRLLQIARAMVEAVQANAAPVDIASAACIIVACVLSSFPVEERDEIKASMFEMMNRSIDKSDHDHWWHRRPDLS
jgi:hypothetical protein